MPRLEFLEDGPKRASHRLVLAHGAGAPMDSPFMNEVSRGIAEAGIRVFRFEFPYMQAQRQDGGKRAPDGKRVLLATWHEAIEALGGGPELVLGGKSMGGRYAAMIGDDVCARGVLCLGYPFHAPGKPERARLESLQGSTPPIRIIQGTRDPMGNQSTVSGYILGEHVQIVWIEDGDHSLTPRKKSGRTAAQAIGEAVAASVEFIKAR